MGVAPLRLDFQFGQGVRSRLIASHEAAAFLFHGVVGLVGEHPRSGAAAAPAFMAANLLHGCTLGGHVALLYGFDFVEQEAAGGLRRKRKISRSEEHTSEIQSLRY